MTHRTKVFGVGWAKTGTTTLGECLRYLGYSHLGARLELVDDLADQRLDRIRETASAYDSLEDWPWLLLFRELDEWFPGSRFVLTVRDPRSWLASYRNMVARGPQTPELQRRRRILYGLPFPNVSDQELIDRYTRHNGDVQEWFAGRSDLLVVDWSHHGWEELCGFLGHPVPEIPFPHANRGDYSART